MDIHDKLANVPTQWIETIGAV